MLAIVGKADGKSFRFINIAGNPLINFDTGRVTLGAAAATSTGRQVSPHLSLIDPNLQHTSYSSGFAVEMKRYVSKRCLTALHQVFFDIGENQAPAPFVRITPGVSFRPQNRRLTTTTEMKRISPIIQNLELPGCSL